MSITNRLNFWRSSAAKSIGVAAALAVFAGFLTPTSASATSDDMEVVMYITSNSTADICVNFDNNDGIPSYVWNDEDHYGDPFATRSSNQAANVNDATFISDAGLSIDDSTSDYDNGASYTLTFVDDNVNASNETSWEYTVDYYHCDILFRASSIDPFDWYHVNFKYRAWLENGVSDDGVNTGSTDNGWDYTDEWVVETPQYVDDNYNNEDDFDTAVGLANQNNRIRDERHTAYFCLTNDVYFNNYNQDGYNWSDYWYAEIAYRPSLRVIDETLDQDVTEEVTVTDGNGYWGEDFPNNSSFSDDCDNYEYGYLIEDLTLGHTYHFEAITTSYYYHEHEITDWWPIFGWQYNMDGSYENYNHLYWSHVESGQFTPLDVRQNQTAVYEPNNNAGCDGPYCYWYTTQWDEGSGDVTNNNVYVTRGDSIDNNTINYTNVDVVLPVDVADAWDNWEGYNLGQAYMDQWADFDIIEDRGSGDWYADSDWRTFAQLNGGWYLDDNGYVQGPFGQHETYFGQDESADTVINSLSNNQAWGTQQTGDAGYYRDFYGQAFVNADLQYFDGVYQGLSDSFSENNNNYTPSWDSTSVRALSTTSVELSFNSGITTYQDHLSDNYGAATGYADSANAVYYVRAVPNYGSHSTFWWNGGFGPETTGNWGGWNNAGDPQPDSAWDNFSSDEDNRPNRYGVIDYVFTNNSDLADELDADGGVTMRPDSSCNWTYNYYYSCDYNGIAQMNLTGLQPGTTYSLEVRVVAANTLGVDDSDYYTWNLADDQWSYNPWTTSESGDGGWLNVQTRQANYAVATTYLDGAAQNVTRTSADVAINLQNSHMVDTLDVNQAGYVAINKCNKYEWADGETICDNPTWQSTADYQTWEESPYVARFDQRTISRYNVMKTEYVDGQLSAIINMTQLTPDTTYEVVFAMDYWPTGAEFYMWGWDNIYPPTMAAYEPSNRYNFANTLDGDFCNGYWDAQEHDAADCYNGVANNDIYRSGVITFTTGDPDMVNPTLSSLTPEDGATDVSVDSDLGLTFDEDVVKGSVGHLIKVWNKNTASVVATVDVTSAAVTGSGSEWSVALPDLNYSNDYYVTVDAGSFLDLAGNAYAGLAGSSADFSTESTDEEGPVLESIGTVSTWQDGKADTDTTITLNFDENVVAGLGEVQIRKASNGQIVRTLVPALYKNIVLGDNKAVITLDGLLGYSTEYFVYVAPEAFSDANGNLFGGNAGDLFNEDAPSNFTTQDKPDLLGTITTSKSDALHRRTFTVSYGADAAFLAVKIYRRDIQTLQWHYLGTVYLDDKGNGSIKLTTPLMQQWEYVQGRVGNHTTSYDEVLTK
ncbi:MAG: hypothetical protein RL410_1332 [Actinomycetota bacterium]